MTKEYSVGRESLTGEETFVLRIVRQVGKPMGEHEFHMIISIAANASGDKSYQFEPKMWEDIDERYKTGLGHVPFSAELHEQIESLVRKGYLARNSEEPILIFEDKQLRFL